MNPYWAFVASQALIGVVQTGIQIYGQAKPDKSHEALLQLYDEMKKAQIQSFQDLKNERKEHEKVINQREEAATTRLMVQRETESKIIKSLMSQLLELEKKTSEERNKLTEEHKTAISLLRSDTAEARRLAEVEHNKELENLRLENEKQAEKIENEVKQAKMNQKMDTKEFEEELGRIAKQREELEDSYNLEMKKILETEKLCAEEILKRKQELKIATKKDQRQHQELEHRLKIDFLDENMATMQSEMKHQGFSRVLNKLQSILEPVKSAYSSLKTIGSSCPIDEDDELPEEGVLEPECQAISEEIDKFRNRNKGFLQFLVAEKSIGQSIKETFLKIARAAEKFMENQKLHRLHTNLHTYVTSKNFKKLKDAGECVDELCGNYVVIKEQLDIEVTKFVCGEEEKQSAIEE